MISLARDNEFPPNLLEEWMRKYYFEARYDISGSGVEPLTMIEFRELVQLDLEELNSLAFRDSNSFAGPELRAALARRFANGDESKVMATHGSSEALFLLLSVLAGPGDEVIAVDPAYPQLNAIVEKQGCVLRRWALREADDFSPNLDTLSELISPRTRLVVANFPHNPTGVSLTRTEFDRLLQLVSHQGCYLLWDAAFAELTYDSEPLPDPSAFYDRAISTGTLSKAYGMPGLRLGWCVASHDVLEMCVRLRDYVSLFLSPFVEFLGCKAIENGDRLVARAKRLARNNLAPLERFARELDQHLEFRVPGAGVCTLVKLKTVSDVDRFCLDLLKDRETLLVPGSCFGFPQHVRLGFGSEEVAFFKGLDQFRRALLQ